MSEQFDFIENRNTFPGRFLIAAVTQSKIIDDLVKCHTSGTPFDIELTINGIKVPFVSTLNDLWERAGNELDSRARTMAKEMVTEAGLDGILKVLQKFEYEFSDAIDKFHLKKIDSK